jgi:hypothetical protein
MSVFLMAAGLLTFLSAVSHLTWRRRKPNAIPPWLAIIEVPLGLVAVILALTANEGLAWIWLLAMVCVLVAEMIIRSRGAKAKL